MVYCSRYNNSYACRLRPDVTPTCSHSPCKSPPRHSWGGCTKTSAVQHWNFTLPRTVMISFSLLIGGRFNTNKVAIKKTAWFLSLYIYVHMFSSTTLLLYTNVGVYSQLCVTDLTVYRPSRWLCGFVYTMNSTTSWWVRLHCFLSFARSSDYRESFISWW